MDGKASFTIPAAQQMAGTTVPAAVENVTTLPVDMSNAWMFACKEDAPSGEKVQLDFYPAFTAFELTLTADSDYDGDITVKKVELISETGLAGNVAATLVTGTRPNTVGTASHTIGASTYVCTPATGNLTYTLPADTKVNKTSSVTFTVFALPQNIAGLKLKFYVKVDGEDASFTGTLSKGGQPITFGACEKHRIKGVAVPGNLWKIFYAPGIIEADQWVEVDGGSIILE